MNWGAFAGGVAEGYESAEKLRLQKQRDERDAEEFAHNKKEWDRQDAAHAAIDAAGNTVATDADPTAILSADDYKTKFAAAPVAKKGWLARQFSSDEPAAAAPAAAPQDYGKKYNSVVDPKSAADFEAWKSGLPADMDKSGKDYDLAGAFNAGLTPEADGHLPDTYKKPNHPTFSNESVYSGKEDGVGGKWSKDEAGKWTFEASPDQLKINKPDDIKSYFSTKERDSRLLLPAAENAPKGGAFGAVEAAAKPKGASKDDYVPVMKDDGSIGYAPRTAVKRLTGPELYERVGKAISQFDPVQGMNMLKGAQELKSGEYKLKAAAIEKAVMDAGRMWQTDPQGALDALSNTHSLVPDGQQVKLTYDPKTNKIQSQFFTETPKGLMPQGKPQTVTWDQVYSQAISYGSPELYQKNLQMTYEHTHQMAMEMNAKAQAANEAKRVAIAQSAESRAVEHQKASDAYIAAKTKQIGEQVGANWTPRITRDPNTNETTTVLLPKGGKGTPKVQSAQWGDKWVSPMFDKVGAKERIDAAAANRGLVAKVIQDPNHPNFGQVVYLNPKTNLFSVNIDEAAAGPKPAARPPVPAHSASEQLLNNPLP